MKIAILDDNEIMRNKIKNIIKQEYLENDILCFSSIYEYEQDQMVFDLLLLDIELPDEHGIEYINSYPQKHHYVIYVSSHDEYMIDAFQKNVMGFVPKTLIEERLLHQIHIVEEAIGKTNKYCFETIDGNSIIEEKQILYAYYDKHTVYLQLENEIKPVLLMTRSLNNISQMLSNDFFKVNRTYIVNMKKIDRLIKNTREVLIINNKKIKVSNHSWARFKLAYHKMRCIHD